MEEYILTVDQGTTSTKAFLLNKDGDLIKSRPVPVSQHYPAPGFVEHDAVEIYLSVLKTMADVLIHNPETVINGIAITNQRETTIAFNKTSGIPYCNAIVWQCRRTAEICRREVYASRQKDISAITGLKLDPYFSATKMRWIMENVPGTEKAAFSGELLFGTVDSYLVYMITGKKSFFTDYSNSSRTMLFDITKLEYSDELLKLFDIPRKALPAPKPSCADYGEVCFDRQDLIKFGLSEEETDALLRLNGVHINAVAGDQAAALFGQTCFEKGSAKTTYGTGCFTLMNIGDKPQFSDNGLLTSAAWSYEGKTVYALEGSVFQGGSVITWLKDALGLIDKPSDCDDLCRSIKDNGGVYLVPAFSGLGAPYWNPDLRGTITGLTGGTGRAHIVRAAVESIAYQVTELVDLMMSDTGITSTHMRVDGGVCACEFLMQLQADLLGVTITRARSDEMTATGVGMLAGLTSGFYSSTDEIKTLYKPSNVYKPMRSSYSARVLLNEYKRAVAASVTASKSGGDKLSQLYLIFFEMAVVLALGIVLGRKKVIDDRGRKVLNDLLLKAVLPFTIISSSQFDYSIDMLRSIGAVAAGASVYYLGSLLALRFIVFRTKIQDSEKRVFITTSVFANTGFVGMPLMYSLFGDPGLLLAAIYNLIYNVFFYTYGVHLLSGKKPSFQEYVNPVSISSILAITLFVIPWRAPGAIVDALDLVGDMTFPLSMIIMGSTLATIDVKKLFSDGKSYAVCFLRMVLFPVLMTLALVALKKFIPILSATVTTLVIMTALPSGAMSVIYSERYDCAPKFAARTVTLSMVFMVITLPLVIAVCLGLFYVGG